jgi:hypothetical protein
MTPINDKLKLSEDKTNCFIISKFVVPYAKYTIEKPNNNKQEEKDPKTKYFKPASVL